MKIIMNASATEGHFAQLARLFQKATSVTLMSPFLADDMAELLGSFDLSNLTHLHLITTLKPRTMDQFRKIDSIVSLIDVVDEDNTIDLRISINNRLHGKVYVFRKADTPIAALITSANFTNSGLLRNDEWGVLIDDPVSIVDVESSIKNAAEYTELTVDDAIEMLEVIDTYRAEHGEPPDDDGIELDLNSVLERRGRPLTIETSTTIWLKPVGDSDHPIVEGEDFSAETDDLHFSRRRPTGVSVCDKVIAYGVGIGMVLTYYTVTSEPERIPDEEMDEEWKERWPWFVEGRNEASHFGGQFWTHGLHINRLVEEYLAERGDDATITSAGGRTLGAFQYGADKIRLSPDFGRFVIRRIESA